MPIIHRVTLSICKAMACLVLAVLTQVTCANELEVGRMAPPITLHTLDGKQVGLQDLRGKVIIVTFWATWCGPCRDELPLLSRYAQAHTDDGLAILGFSLDSPDDIEQVRAVARSLSFPVGLLGDPHVSGYGRIWHLPVSFTIDRDGRLVDNGWKDKQPAWTSEQLEQIVTPLLDRAH
jgi:cytochrome c biogenesis protein CcmG, thiol:disulfide interchange protein DsbE